MQNHDHITNELIGLIYETAKEPNIWPILLNGLSSMLNENKAEDIKKSFNSEADNVYQLAVGSNGLVSQAHEILRNSSQESLITELAPHFKLALDINKQLSAATKQRDGVVSALEKLPLGIIVVDQNAIIINMNEQAKKIIEEKEVLNIKNNTIVTHNIKETNKLHLKIKSAINDNKEEGTSSNFSLRTNKKIKTSLLLTANHNPSTNQRSCSLLIATSEAEQNVSLALLKELYDLSPAEARVAQHLLNGLSLKEITEALNLSLSTIRTQLKSIFSKTDTHRQSELIGKLLSEPAIIFNKNIDTTTASLHLKPSYEFHPKNGREYHLKLKDGRNLCYAEYGDPKGIPIFFCHSIISCRLQTPPNPEKLHDFGIRFIIPDRPGFGKSTHRPNRSLLDWTDDFKQLLTHLDIEKFYIIGYSAGGPYAAAIAYRFPEQVKRLGLVSSMMPYKNLRELDGMKPAHKMILALGRYTPTLLMPFLHVMVKGLLNNPENYLKRIISDWAPRDLEMIEDRSLMNETTDCFEEVIKNGTEGLFHEHFLLTKPWEFKLENIQAKTLVWHGTDDCVFSYKCIQRCTKIPNSQLTSYPNEGHLLILDHWQEILEKITQ